MPNSNFMSEANATAIFTAYATAIKLGLKAWVGTTAEWDQLTDAQKKQYQVNFKTDDCSEESIEVVKRSIADDFSISVNYAVGEYCYHLGDLYKFTSAHTAGAWSSADVEQVQVCDELSELKNTLTCVEEALDALQIKKTTVIETTDSNGIIESNLARASKLVLSAYDTSSIQTLIQVGFNSSGNYIFRFTNNAGVARADIIFRITVYYMDIVS